MSQKVKEASEYIASLREKSPDELEEMIKSVAGEELTVFFHSYAGFTIAHNTGLASSLMLLGYMCRVNEETGGMYITQKRTQA